MYHKAAVLVAFLVLAFPIAAQEAKRPAHKVTVLLTNGKIVNGDFEGASRDEITLNTETGRLTIRLEALESIRFSVSTRMRDDTSPSVLALRALKGLQSSVAIGISFLEYSRRLADAKIIVDENLAKIPNGDLKKTLSATLDMYVLAKLLWDADLSYPGSSNTERQHKLDETLSTTWKEADASLAKAEKLIQ